MPEDDDSPICLLCNRPVKEFGDLCAICEGENEQAAIEADTYWSALEEDAADFVDTGGES